MPLGLGRRISALDKGDTEMLCCVLPALCEYVQAVRIVAAGFDPRRIRDYVAQFGRTTCVQERAGTSSGRRTPSADCSSSVFI